MKNSSVDLLRGPILRSLLIFALPILISNIFQQLYNTADVMIVGRFLGPDALAAVGASSAIFDLVIGFALGVGNGMGVVIARYYGAQDYRKLRQSVAATVVIGLGLSALVMILGHFGLYPLLRFLEHLLLSLGNLTSIFLWLSPLLGLLWVIICVQVSSEQLVIVLQPSIF